MFEISTSVLNAEKGKEAEIILGLEKARTDYFHIDVMDGKFVKKNTYKQMKEISSYIKRISNLPLDVHLMVEDIKEGIEDFLSYDPNIITFHIEACKNKEDVYKFIKLIKENHTKVGLAIKPKTDIEQVLTFLPYINLVLVMTVEPGKGGQTLLIDMVDKVEKISEYIKNNNLETVVEVDGGVNLSTCDKLKKSGAEILVAGTAILLAKDYGEIITELKAE